MKKTQIVSADISLLENRAVSLPVIPREEFEARLCALREKMRAEELSHVVVYADREHFSNMYFLTGYDPRFEEALLIVGAGEDDVPTLLVGNEGYDYCFISPLELKRVLYQNFSLQGQPRDRLRPLEDLLREAGLAAGSRVGVVGMKYFEAEHIDDCDHAVDIPAYILRRIERVSGGEAVNCTWFMTGGTEGLRMTHSARQIAIYEYAACESSNRLINMLKALKDGTTEIGVSAAAGFDGQPLCVYPNINFGAAHLGIGLRSPDFTALKAGMPVMISAALRGSLVCRAGIAARDESDYSGEYEGALDAFIRPFFETVALWMESVRIGVCAGDVHTAIKKKLSEHNLVSALNPGHSIAEDEWPNSVFRPGSEHKLVSGMYIQSDIIAGRAEGAALTGIFEDGFVLADEKLRAEIAEQYPETWERMQIRRRFIREVVGLDIAEELLPMSNLCGVYFPFLMDLGRVFALREE